jgi:hypothetical protein
LVEVRAQSAEQKALSRTEVEAFIRQTADGLRGHPGAETRSASSDLAAVAASLGRQPGIAATLRAIGADSASTPLESGLARILLAHIESPEVFTAVAPYYESGAEDPLARLLPKPRAPRPPMGVLKPLALDLLHPDTRAVVASYPDAYAELVAAMQRLWSSARSREAGDTRAWEDIRREREKSLAGIYERFKVPEREFELLAQASGACLPALPRLDPRYLPAWEEGMVRSDVTWLMKGQLLYVVTSFDAAGSAPILALSAEQALVQRPASAVEGRLYETFVSQAVAALADRPAPESLFALADIVVHAEGDKQLELQRMIGKRVTESDRWGKMLDTYQGDTHLGASVRSLREAVAKWKEYKPTYYRGRQPP